MTRTNPNRPWGSAEAVLQLANDIDPYTRSTTPSESKQYVAAEELRARAGCGRPGVEHSRGTAKMVPLDQTAEMEAAGADELARCRHKAYLTDNTVAGMIWNAMCAAAPVAAQASPSRADHNPQIKDTA